MNSGSMSNASQNLQPDNTIHQDNFPITCDALFRQAEDARQHAYCRYSGFAVGAAILTASGEIYTGCNIENAAYPSGICAERVACATAVAAGHRKFRAIAIAGSPGTCCTPCGACRQFLAEFCEEDCLVILDGNIFTLGQLLPAQFILSYSNST